MRKILHVGCGTKKFECSDKVIGLDIVKLPGVDVIHDLNEKPYPFEDNEFDEILAIHVLEHVNDLIVVMEEFYRILRHGGLVKIIVPYYSSPTAFHDPTHKRLFTLRTFEYFSTKSEYSYYFKNPINFKILQKKFIPYDTFLNKSIIFFMNVLQNFYEAHLSKLIPPKELEVILQKV